MSVVGIIVLLLLSGLFCFFDVAGFALTTSPSNFVPKRVGLESITAMSSSSSTSTTTHQQEEIIVIRQPSLEFLQSKGVFDWGTWGCGISKFPWTYHDNESCYLLAGQVTVTPRDSSDRKSVSFGKGDFVTFPAGLSCTWDVTEAVEKHYMFF